MTTTTMTATERTAKRVETCKVRLAATRDRMNGRMVNATLSRQKAEAALTKAQERLEKATAKLAKTKGDAEALITKQAGELKAAEEKHAETLKREQEKAQKAAAKADREDARMVGGSVETESGDHYELTHNAVETIKKHIGRRRKGCFSPIDGTEATEILEAVENPKFNLGDVFVVAMKGRKTTILFSVENDGLRFETETK